MIVTAGLFATQEELENDPQLAARLLAADFTNTVLFCEEARKRLLAAAAEKGTGTFCAKLRPVRPVLGKRSLSPFPTLCVFSSVAGERGRKPVILYGAAKAGLSRYLEGLDHKFRRPGLRTVCVKPGFVKTGMTAGLKPPPFAGTPEDVARRVLKAIDRGWPEVYVPAAWRWVMCVDPQAAAVCDAKSAVLGEHPMLAGLIRLARPKDWIKNVFVLAPVPFALHKARGALRAGRRSCWGWRASAWSTRPSTRSTTCATPTTDRLHPQKCRRPIAAGTVSALGRHRTDSPVGARSARLLCHAVGQAGRRRSSCRSTSPVNVAYNLGAKHVALLDVFLLSSGFVIRVLLGCALVSALSVAVAAAMHLDAGVVPRLRQTPGRSDRGTGPQPSAQPARLQHARSWTRR